ncbi:MAG TPA: inner membrane CreD family protein [Candidatus Paceibacterota bacterium]|nr:inner membrane CreD family protein [Candidatus Paceibacterota bacterium]
MDTPAKHANRKLLAKVLSIMLVLAISYAASLFVQSVVNDRIANQTSALETQSGDTSHVLIFGKLPGFDSSSGISVYRLVDRVLKYAILFITLTFLIFFLTEIFYKLKLHPIQYLLVGLALAEFYLLLLALTEQVGFLWAYGIAAFMTILLISLYSRFILATAKGAIFIAMALTAIYLYLLMILNLETLALLFGALLLFALLSAIMFATRKLNWYEAFGYLQKIDS